MLIKGHVPMSWLPLSQMLVSFGMKHKDAQGLLLEYFEFYSKTAKHHGNVTAVKVLKDLRNRYKLLVAKQAVKDNRLAGIWFTLNSDGTIKRLRLLNTWLTCTDYQVNPTLLVLNLVDSFTLSPSSDVSSIEDPFKGNWDGKTEGEFLEEWTKSIQQVIQPQSEPIVWTKPHCSLKAGPLHPSAILSSGLEVLSFMKAPEILKTFLERCSVHGAHDLRGRLESMINYVNNRPYHWTIKKLFHVTQQPSGYGLAKMAYLAEKAGKTRLVYILNWWMQSLLHPLHSSMMEWLRKQPQDGTFDQTSAVNRLVEWTKGSKPIYSFDLTAATDRWPKSHQRVVIARFAGEEWAMTWDFCLGIKPWSEPHHRFLHYSVGQPMGAYASWAALAMTHHCLLRSICLKVRAPMDCYMVLGDDVVINNGKVAELYQQYITEFLGVDISQGKSLLPVNQISGNAGEFAKQIVVDGKNLTQVSTILLDQVWNKHQWWMFHTLVQDLMKTLGWTLHRTKGELLVPAPLAKLLKTFNKSTRTKLEILISDPCCLGHSIITDGVNLCTTGSSYVTIADPWADIATMEILTYKLDVVETKFQNRMSQVKDLIQTIGRGRLGTRGEWLLLQSPAHPVKYILENLDEVLMDMYRTIAQGFTPANAANVFTDIDYLNKVVYGNLTHRQWKDAKTLRKQGSAGIVQSIYVKCTAPTPNVNVINTDEWCWG